MDTLQSRLGRELTSHILDYLLGPIDDQKQIHKLRMKIIRRSIHIKRHCDKCHKFYFRPFTYPEREKRKHSLDNVVYPQSYDNSLLCPYHNTSYTQRISMNCAILTGINHLRPIIRRKELKTYILSLLENENAFSEEKIDFNHPLVRHFLKESNNTKVRSDVRSVLSDEMKFLMLFSLSEAKLSKPQIKV